MSTPSVDKRQDKYHDDDIDTFREMLRNASLPVGTNGYVAEDHDIVMRWYGMAHYGLDEIGRFRQVEKKFTRNPSGLYTRRAGEGLPQGQKMTFRLEHITAVRGDKNGERYDGSYVLHHDMPPNARDHNGERVLVDYPTTKYWLYHIMYGQHTRVRLTQPQVIQFANTPYAVNLPFLPIIPPSEHKRFDRSTSLARRVKSWLGYKDNVAPHQEEFLVANAYSIYCVKGSKFIDRESGMPYTEKHLERDRSKLWPKG